MNPSTAPLTSNYEQDTVIAVADSLSGDMPLLGHFQSSRLHLQ
jgi:hypothetical protein